MREEMRKTEKWGIFELVLKGNEDGNPYTDYEIYGYFSGEHENKKVFGFYDGDHRYVIRFMPSFEGIYTYRVEGSFTEAVYEGQFEVMAATDNNHGPVRVCNLSFCI